MVDVGRYRAWAINAEAFIARELDVLADFSNGFGTLLLEIRAAIGGVACGNLVIELLELFVLGYEIRLAIDLDDRASCRLRTGDGR